MQRQRHRHRAGACCRDSSRCSPGERALDRAQGGLGIGLALAQALVELHGGRSRRAAPEPGQGSEFIVRLPAIGGAAPLPGAPAPTQVEGERAPLRAALGRQPRRRRDRLRAARVGGHEAQLAGDGEEALGAEARELRPEVAISTSACRSEKGFEVSPAESGEAWGGGMLDRRHRLGSGGGSPLRSGCRLRPPPGQAGEPSRVARPALLAGPTRGRRSRSADRAIPRSGYVGVDSCDAPRGVDGLAIGRRQGGVPLAAPKRPGRSAPRERQARPGRAGSHGRASASGPAPPMAIFHARRIQARGRVAAREVVADRAQALRASYPRS